MTEKQTTRPMAPLVDVIQEIPTNNGTYGLLYRCEAPFRVAAGRLGLVSLCIGHWIYIGSAFGPGGLRARLAHHLRPSPRPHWHLDYIKHGLRPIEIWLTTAGVKNEHVWANDLARLKGASCPIAGFGASDCACRAHLVHLRRRPGFSGFKRRVRKDLQGDFARILLSRPISGGPVRSCRLARILPGE